MKAIVFGTIFLGTAVLFLWAALRNRSTVGRGGLGALMLLAAGVNVVAALTNPHSYVDLYGDRAWLPGYREVITGAFADNARVVVLLIATGQAAAGILTLAKGRAVTLGLLGMLVFLLAATPLGPETSINLLYAAASALLLRNEYDTTVPTALTTWIRREVRQARAHPSAPAPRV